MPTVNVKKFDVGKLTKITNGNVYTVKISIHIHIMDLVKELRKHIHTCKV